MKIALIIGLFLAGVVDAAAWHGPSPELEVLVNGAPVPKYCHKGTTYLEALKGQEYQIRITNPTGARVAVALSVDGLNTIDARHTEARFGRKWVLEPYQSIVISGWQTNARQARRFFFTTEERSYGALLNRTQNLGIISAVFFREKIQPVLESMHDAPVTPPASMEKSKGEAHTAAAKAQAPSPAPEPDYAATGIGNRIRHEVQSVYMELEDRPFATCNLRYEFRAALVKLGVVPPTATVDPLVRRERARGFRDSSFCPEPN